MPSKLGPHFIGTPGLPRWLAAGVTAVKFDPTSLGASAQVAPGILVVGKLDQEESQIGLVDWKRYRSAGQTPQETARLRFEAQRNIYVGANKPRVDRYAANARVDVWEDDNEVHPDDEDEARWYAEYCIAMMEQYEAIGRKRANFCFAVGNPPLEIWPYLLPAVRHARERGHYLALHEYMGYEADLGVGWNQVDGDRRPVRLWHGRRTADGDPDESYPYGWGALRYRLVYDTILRPEGLHETPLLITECGCDDVGSITPVGMPVGTWKEHREHWAAEGKDPESHYAGMLRWYDERLREDAYVRGATVFTVGSVPPWHHWDIAGTRVEDELLAYIAAERGTEDTPVSDAPVEKPVTLTAAGGDNAIAAGFAASVDLNRVGLGQSFQASWTFRNTGTTTWTGDYRLAYSDTPHPETSANNRSPLGAAGSYAITDLGAPAAVPPGASASLTLTLTAPPIEGIYGTNWQLEDPSGRRFGPIRWLRAVVVRAADSLRLELISFRNTAGDYTHMQPGREFAGIWTVRNTGTAPWTGDFAVVYADESTADTANAARDRMGAAERYTLRELTGRERVEPGEAVEIRLDLVAPRQPGAYAFHWRLTDAAERPFGGLRWLTVTVVGGPSPIPKPTAPIEFGMNINPDVHGLDVERLEGLSWVRFVYFASRLNLSPEEAYQQRYRNLIQTYAAAGISSLIILHQDTEWGNAPWQNGGWEQYAETFARACGRVAAVCSEFGDQVAYQIFNEQDSGPDNHSAIGIAAENYAIVLDKAQAAIRAAHPGAVVVIGGLNTGPDNALRYVRAVQARLGGRLPVDALAIHPYGRYVKLALFNYGSIGKLSDSLDRFQAAFPDKPLWITEVGAASDSPIGPEHYADIATYIREFYTEVADRYAGYVQVLIWFAWTDMMRNSGILTADGQPKAHIYDAFLGMKARGREALEAAAAEGLEAAGTQANATFESFSTTLDNANAVPAGTPFTNRWTFTNSGATAWGPEYRLVYAPQGSTSDPMTDQTSYALADVMSPAEVPPGGQAQITLNLTAPERDGRVYRSPWQLRDPNNVAFGHLYAEISVVPAPTAGTGARAAGMTFLADRTVPDGTWLVAASDFDKQWLVRNSGDRQWGKGFRLVFVEGDLQMARGVPAHMVPEARPGEEVVLTVPMTVPPATSGAPTTYRSSWRLQDDRGNFFGPPVWVVVVATPAVAGVMGGMPARGATALAQLAADPTTWYSQLDPRWADVPVGFGSQPMKRWGCLLTCMAMVLTAYGKRVTPAELNDLFKTQGEQGFRGANVQFIAPAVALPGLRQGRNVKSLSDSGVPDAEPADADPIARIDNALSQGWLVLAQVDITPTNGSYDSNIDQHWVILLRRTAAGDDYLMLDPVVPGDQVNLQPRSLMLKYGNPRPSATADENLRDAIKSALIYFK